MNLKCPSATLTLSLMPLLAYAEPEKAAKVTSPLVEVIYFVLPIILVAIVTWFFMRVFQRIQKRNDDYTADQKRHNERVEQLLERIAKATENKTADTD
jgi:hypothetical protein